MSTFVSPEASVEDGVTIGEGSKIWDQVKVRVGAEVGRACVVGRGAFIDAGVRVGDRCKIQNHALLYAPAVLGPGVFIGPAAVLTNDRFPRAVAPDGSLKQAEDWEPAGVTVGEGASVGAQAVVIGGVHIGAWSLVAAGAVVAEDVAAFALVAGTPARRIRWVGRAGEPLAVDGDARWRCPRTGEQYREIDAETLELL